MGHILRRRGGLQPVLVLLILALVPAYRLARAAQLYRHRTEHYEVRSDISPLWAEVVGRHMEQIFAEYSRRFASYGRANAEFDIYVFRREADYRAKVPSQVSGSTGVFVGGPDYLAAHAENRTPEEVLRTLYHEGLHQFIYEVVSEDCPIWINEGLAEYFSEATWNGRQFELGQVPSERLRIVQNAIETGSFIRFHALMSMSPESWIQTMRTDAHRASLAYSQAWSMVQFLLHGEGGRFAPSVNRFLQAIATGYDQAKALQEAFGANLNLQAFEKSWAQYMMSLEPSPKFTCRANMEGLMVLAKAYYSRNPGRFRRVWDLRNKAVDGGGWSLQLRDGREVRSDESEAVEQMFRCPFDRSGAQVSYLVVQDPSTNLPVMVCTHHPGIIIKAYYERDSGGDLKVKVEEQVRTLLKPEFRKAISAKLRGSR